MILHCMAREGWEAVKRAGSYVLPEGEPFLHGSPVSFFWRVAPNFRETQEELVLLCIVEEDRRSAGRTATAAEEPIRTFTGR